MFLNEENQKYVREMLSEMEEGVKLIYFTQAMECQYCKETRQLLEELATLTDKLTLETHDFIADRELAEQLGVDKIPAIVVSNIAKPNSRIKFYGIPSGYEFTSVLEDILDVSRNNHGFSEDILREVQAIRKPVHIQVFVTPTCPYCPAAVRTAHRLALVNENITADMVEATEFPHLGQKYAVRGVPKSVINEKWSVEGAVPEKMVVDKIMQSIA